MIDSVPHSVVLFSQKFNGTQEAWNWLCERSNGREAKPPILTAEQARYALQAGYITTNERLINCEG